jgi:hypothetical protein
VIALDRVPGSIPILMLTGRSDEADRAMGSNSAQTTT